MTESTDAVARMIILEKLANVSFLVVMYNYKIYFYNLLYSQSVTLYTVVTLLPVYITMCQLP